MQHCQNTIYANDHYCCDCGDILTQKRELLTAEDIHPQLLDEVKQQSPDSEVITGVIKSMYYYKRRYVSRTDNMLYGFWWLAVEDKNGLVHEFNIDAEKDVLANLKKGDVISAFQTKPLVLTYSFASNDAKDVVKNNRFIPIVIAHLEQSQYRCWDKTIDRNYTGGTVAWLVVSLIMLGCLLGFTPLTFLPAAMVTLPVLIGLFMYEYKYHKKAKARKEAHYDAIFAASETLLSTSKYQLGYHLQMREPAKSDVICFSCQQRISQDVAHCYCCGAKQAVLDVPTASTDEDEATLVGATKNEAATLTKPVTIADLEQALMLEYSGDYQTDYMHKNVLGRDEKGHIFHRAILGKVIDKDQRSNTQQTQQAITTTETTRVYRGGHHVNTYEEKTTEIHRQRNTTLKGEIMLETSDGSPYVFYAGEDLLGSVDVGDWLFYAYSQVDTTRYNSYYREYAYNISKDRCYSTNTVTNFGMLYGYNMMVLLGLVAAGVTWYLDSEDFYPLLNTMLPESLIIKLQNYPDIVQHLDMLPMALYGLICVVSMVLACIYSMRNAAKLRKSVSKLTLMITQFKNNYASVLEQIKKLT